MTLREHRDQHKTADALIKQKAANLYATLDKNERVAVQFGMFPAAKMRNLDDELSVMAAEGIFPMYDKCDLARLAAVGIMDAANADKDKLVV